MRMVAGIVLGAILGLLCGSFGLIDTSLVGVQIFGGNEWTPFISGGGAIAGALIGTTSFFRRHAFSFVLVGLGLIMAIVLRDEYFLQPPIVFLDLFGIPLIGAAIGIGLDRWRSRSTPRPTIVVAMGVAVTLAVGVATFAISGGPDDFLQRDDCEVVGDFTRCDLRSGNSS